MQYLHVFVQCMLGFSAVCSMKQSLFKTCMDRKRDLVPFERASTASILKCAANCLGTERCTAANFVQDSHMCELLDAISSNEECSKSKFEQGTTFLVMMRPATGEEITETSTAENTQSTNTDSVVSTETTETVVIQCLNNQTYDGSQCVCEPPLTGEFCENGPRDCYGHTVYNWTDIYPEDGKGKIRVLCGEIYLYAFVATEHGFTPEFLNRTWLDYKLGFGDIPDLYTTVGGYWLGNDNIRRITNGTLSYKLNFYGHVDGRVKVGDYMNFQLSSETEHYTESYTTYSSTDNMDRVLEKDRPFIAFDRDENGCAATKNTGFWFDMDCQIQPPLFGRVKIGGNSRTYGNFWVSLIRI